MWWNNLEAWRLLWPPGLLQDDWLWSWMVTVQQSTGQKIVQSGVHKTLPYWELLYLYMNGLKLRFWLESRSSKKLEISLLCEVYSSFLRFPLSNSHFLLSLIKYHIILKSCPVKLFQSAASQDQASLEWCHSYVRKCVNKLYVDM